MEVKTERVDDIPLIKAEFAKSDLTNLLVVRQVLNAG